ncbi:exported hypothetical protein [Cupriavidus taiwanensis]|nr:exported hypothetical protein [Cupriavidus taiwanensis]
MRAASLTGLPAVTCLPRGHASPAFLTHSDLPPT